MRTIITVTQNPARAGRSYLLSVLGLGVEKTRRRAGNCPSGAAALAVQNAMVHGAGGYCIIAPREVMESIPTDIRSA